MNLRGNKRFAVVVLVAFAATTLPFYVGAVLSPATAAGAKAATVSPDSDLIDIGGDGQFVTVSWTHFPAGQVVYALECVRGATQADSQCSQGGNFFSICGHACPGWAYLGPSDRQGAGRSIVQVAIGVINTLPNLDPIAGATFTCDWQHDCSFFLTTDVTLLTGAVEVPIAFSKPVDACPTGGTFLSPSGSAAANRIFLAWATAVCTPPTSIGLSYVLKPGTNAIDDYVAGAAPFAVSPYPLSNSQQKQLDSHGETAAYAPMSASALVFGFRIKDQATGSWLTHLVLTPDLLAQIFTGQITTWTDPRIAVLNPGVAFPSSTFTIGRGDACEETLGMTTWMWANARQAWIDGGTRSGLPFNPFDTGPTDILPSLSAQQPSLYTGARKIASVLAVGDGDATSTTSYGWIGYLDSTWAAQYDLATVTIQYGAGSAPDPSRQVSATYGQTGTVENAISHMKPDGDGVLEPDVSIQDPAIWPLPTISYAIVPHKAPEGSGKGQVQPATADAISTLLKYGVGDGQSSLAAGYVPLPSSLTQQTVAAADAISTGAPPGGGSSGPGPPAQPPLGSTGSTGTDSTGDGTSTAGSNTQVVLVQPKVPPLGLAASASRVLFPGVVALGLGSIVVGPILLFGDRFGPAMRRIGSSTSRRARGLFSRLRRPRVNA